MPFGIRERCDTCYVLDHARLSRVGRWRAVAALLVIAVLAPVPPAPAAEEPKPRPPVPGAVVLFDGVDTSHWVRRGSMEPSPWKIEDGAWISQVRDIATKDSFGDFQLHLEFMEPDLPKARGQAKGNSGVYIQGRYEIQILDSYGIAVPGKGDCGAVYTQSAPLVNACKPPLQWQTFDLFFRAPRFDATGKRTEKARVTVLQNGITVQNNTEIEGPTGAARRAQEAATGPIALQYHRSSVRFRNIWILPLPPQGSNRYAPE